jgi:hypothetical protein
MELLNEVQQFRAHAGSHKRTAILAGRFCQSGILAIEAPSKYPIIVRLFGSTGSVHGVPPNFDGNDDTKLDRMTGLKCLKHADGWLLPLEPDYLKRATAKEKMAGNKLAISL